MKKISKKQRLADVNRNLQLRKVIRSTKTLQKCRKSRKKNRKSTNRFNWKMFNNWIDQLIDSNSINITKLKKNRLVLFLPKVMNFSDQYEATTLHINVIRKITSTTHINAYKLVSVRFNDLLECSTSASLVLTAEISRWDDNIRNQLIPDIESWNENILKQFCELGFFELFKNQPKIEEEPINSALSTVKYIKSHEHDVDKTIVLKHAIQKIVGEKISKWTFLYTGLSEAITNVVQHAYPKNTKTADNERYWYLTASFNKSNSLLKIAFYDQGIGIPRALPSSTKWEKILSYLSKFPIGERKFHKHLLKAAVEVGRTQTDKSDRGKGLSDMLQFTKQRKDGYLSIMSLKALYKYSISNGKSKDKAVSFALELPGTLIIWCIKLQNI